MSNALKLLGQMEAADAALSAVMKAHPLEAEVLRGALVMHSPHASVRIGGQSELDKSLSRALLAQLEAADGALEAVMAKRPMEASNLRAAIEQHGPYASTSIGGQCSCHPSAASVLLVALEAADATIHALMAQPPEAVALREVIEQFGHSASASIGGDGGSAHALLAAIEAADARVSRYAQL